MERVMSQRSHWMRVVALGVCVSVAAIWPASIVRLKYAQLLWQPVLVGLLLLMVWHQQSRYGWMQAIMRCIGIYAMFTIAAWLPWLRESHGPPFASGYRYYLWLYEGAIAAAIGYVCVRVGLRGFSQHLREQSWRGLVLCAPILLIVRGWHSTHWGAVTSGVIIGMLVAILVYSGRLRWDGWRRWPSWCVPLVLAVLAMGVVYAAGYRIYTQTGTDFPIASDDGDSYYRQAVMMAEHPHYFFTDELKDQLFFTGYYPLMALWFMAVGSPHTPSWLLWHGVAGAILALCMFALGRRLGGTWCGVAAALLVLGNHVMLHLMGTMNMETFFVPVLYVMLWLWVVAGTTRRQQLPWAWWTGFVLGIATVIRPTSVLMPVAFAMMLVWERSRLALPARLQHGTRMVCGFLVPVYVLYVRNWIAWGQWTLASSKAEVSAAVNSALIINGLHVSKIGWDAWLQQLLEHPYIIWTQLIPNWIDNVLALWTHRGFGQMDLIKGLNYSGYHQAAIGNLMLIGVVLGVVLAWRQRDRLSWSLLMLPCYFTSLAIPFLVLNSRYRSPFIPALYLLCCWGYASCITQIRGGLTPALPSTTEGVVRGPEMVYQCQQ